MAPEAGTIAIVGSGGMAAACAERWQAMGRPLVGFGEFSPRGWPSPAAFQTVESADGLDAALAANSPESLVVFGADPGVGPGRHVELVSRALASVSRLPLTRLVYWGSTQVYAGPDDGHDRALLEEARLAAGSRRSSAAIAADEAAQELVRTHAVPEVFLFRAALVPDGDLVAGLPSLGRMRLLPIAAVHRPVQLLDRRDAVEVLTRAVTGGQPGVYNVGADGLLRVTEMCQALGHTPVRLPGVLRVVGTTVARWTNRAGPAASNGHLTSGTIVVDNARLKTHFGYRPRFTSRDALAAARDAAPATIAASAL